MYNKDREKLIKFRLRNHLGKRSLGYWSNKVLRLRNSIVLIRKALYEFHEVVTPFLISPLERALIWLTHAISTSSLPQLNSNENEVK